MRRLALLAALAIGALAQAQGESRAWADAAADAGADESAPAAPAVATPTPANDSDARAALTTRVDDLARQLGDALTQLDRQAAELARLRADVDHAATMTPAAFRVGGLRVSLFGFVQADVVAYDQASLDEVDPSTGAPLNDTRFLLRRARLRADASYGWVAGAVEFDGNTIAGPVARILVAEVSACWPRCTAPVVPDARGRSVADPAALDQLPLAMGTLGLMRIPFGFEVQEKDWVRLFLERSNAERAFFPGEFDLGARVQGGWRWLRWQLAAMNGHPSGEKQYALADPTRSKDFLGRLGGDVWVTARLHIAGGVSALYGTGFAAGTPATKDTLVWRDLNGDGQVDPNNELSGIAGAVGTPSRTFNRNAVAGDVRVSIDLPRVGPLLVYGELTWATNLDRGLTIADPYAAGHTLRELGWYVAAAQQLTKWAALGLRYDAYNPDADARQQAGVTLVPRDRSFTTLSLVAAAFVPPFARLSLEWDHNRNPLGISNSGAPLTLGSDVVTIRGQVEF